MNYQGDINLGETIDVKFTTVSTTGVPTTLAGTPAVAAYVDNDTTEKTAGITLSVDFDSRTGLHNVRVVASSGNGFTTAMNVNLVITAGTVGGSSVVGYVIGSFSIEKRSAARPAQVNTECDTALADVGLTTTVTGRIDASVSSRASQTSVDTIDDYVDTEVSAIKAKTDQLAFTGGTVNANATISMSAGDLNNIADALLKRDFSAVSGEAARSLINAARFLRNKWSVAGTTLTVTKEDDSTSAWTSTLVTTPGADPITSSDPA